MTKQEEIREGIITNIAKACPSMLNKDTVVLADKILKDEDSQGVMIKVGGISDDLAETASQPEIYYADKVGLSWERDNYVFKAFKMAGYVRVEPLIKEK